MDAHFKPNKPFALSGEAVTALDLLSGRDGHKERDGLQQHVEKSVKQVAGRSCFSIAFEKQEYFFSFSMELIISSAIRNEKGRV